MRAARAAAALLFWSGYLVRCGNAQFGVNQNFASSLTTAVPVLINALNGARFETPLERAAETLNAARGTGAIPSGTTTTTTLGAAIPIQTATPVASTPTHHAASPTSSTPAQAPGTPAAASVSTSPDTASASSASTIQPTPYVINQGVQVSSSGVTLSGNGGGSGVRIGTDGITYNAGAGTVDVQQLAAVASALSGLAQASGVSNVHVGMDGLTLNRGTPGEMKVSLNSRGMVLTAPSADSPDKQASVQLAIPRNDAAAAPVSLTVTTDPAAAAAVAAAGTLGAGRQVVNSVPALPVAGDAANAATMLAAAIQGMMASNAARPVSLAQAGPELPQVQAGAGTGAVDLPTVAAAAAATPARAPAPGAPAPVLGEGAPAPAPRHLPHAHAALAATGNRAFLAVGGSADPGWDASLDAAAIQLLASGYSGMFSGGAVGGATGPSTMAGLAAVAPGQPGTTRVGGHSVFAADIPAYASIPAGQAAAAGGGAAAAMAGMDMPASHPMVGHSLFGTSDMADDNTLADITPVMAPVASSTAAVSSAGAGQSMAVMPMPAQMVSVPAGSAAILASAQGVEAFATAATQSSVPAANVPEGGQLIPAPATQAGSGMQFMSHDAGMPMSMLQKSSQHGPLPLPGAP